MTEYSRDAQSPVLHALSGLYLAIRGGLFSPDASRSGRWNGCHNLEDAVKVLAAAPLLSVDSEPTGEDNLSGDSSGKSTSSSSSEGEEVSKCGLIASAGFRKVDLFPEQIMRKCAKCFPCRQRQ